MGRVLATLFAVWVMLLCGACHPASKSRGAPRIEVRWEGEERFERYEPGSRRKVPAGRPALELRVTPPDDLDTRSAAMFIDDEQFVAAVTQNGRPLARGRLPIFTLENTRDPIDVRLAYDRTYTLPLTIVFGSSVEVTDDVLERGLSGLLVALILIPIGAALLILGLVRSYARPYAWLGLFAAIIGILNVGASSLHSLVFPSPAFWRYAIPSSVLGYQVAFTRFIDASVQGGDRVLRILSASILIWLLVALGLAAVGLMPMGMWSAYAFPVAALGLLWSGRVLVPRALRGEETARNILASFGVLLLFGLPDQLGAMGFTVLPFLTGHFGTLACLLLLIPLIERGYERKRLEAVTLSHDLELRVEDLTKRGEEIAALNAELRHQVAARSHQLGELLLQGPVEPSPLVEGELFATRYRLLKQLGSGGMGVVFEVERQPDRRRLALKVLREVASPRDAARFTREAEIAARFDHPNLVAVTDAGIDRGRLYLVMELVHGGGLDECAEKFGDPSWALPILAEVAVGIAVLHEANVIHRDLKPPNVLLAKPDRRARSKGRAFTAKISDFGIARATHAEAPAPSARGGTQPLGGTAPMIDPNAPTVDIQPQLQSASSAGPAARLTATGGIIGTPLYMAPEMADTTREISRAVDIFAFGVMAFELLDGEVPFEMPPVLLALGGREAPPPRPLRASVEPELARALSRCLASDPTQRPTAKELSTLLAPALDMP